MADGVAPEARRFGLRLKSVRVQQDRDVKDVAIEVGVSPQAYYAYEAGRASFSYTLLPRLASALRVSIGELLDRLYGDEADGPVELKRSVRRSNFEPEQSGAFSAGRLAALGAGA